MDFKRLGNLLMVLGAIVVAGACIWWASFYSSLARDLGRAMGSTPEAGLSDALSCLYSSSGICGLVSGVAALAGRTVYEPMLFWFGVAGLVLGLIIRFAAKPAGSP